MIRRITFTIDGEPFEINVKIPDKQTKKQRNTLETMTEYMINQKITEVIRPKINVTIEDMEIAV